MLLKITAISGLLFVADLPPSLKDAPGFTPSAVAPRQYTRPVEKPPRLPGSVMLPDPRPYVRVEGYEGRMAMTPEELRRWGLRSGQTVGLGLATLIIEDKMKAMDNPKRKD